MFFVSCDLGLILQANGKGDLERIISKHVFSRKEGKNFTMWYSIQIPSLVLPHYHHLPASFSSWYQTRTKHNKSCTSKYPKPSIFLHMFFPDLIRRKKNQNHTMCAPTPFAKPKNPFHLSHSLSLNLEFLDLDIGWWWWWWRRQRRR